MKNAFVLICLKTIFFSSQATILQVDNNPNSPAPYTNLQAACDAASHGDTIYVAGSPFNYGNVTVDDKAVHIIGIGYQPDKQNSLPTSVNNVTFGYNATGIPFNTASGSSIEGCFIDGRLGIYGNGSSSGNTYVQNIVVKRCLFDWDVEINYGSNLLMINNLGVAPELYYASHAIISNNIFTDNYFGSNTNTNVTFSNNLFLGGSYAMNAPFYTNFINNIFVKNFIWQFSSGGNSSFSNNIFFCSNNNLPAGTNSTNTFSNNLLGANPTFISPATIANQSNFQLDFTHDYHLSSGSAGKNAGTDGTDIGIYGGSHPWPDGGASGSGFMYTQEPNIPQVNQLDIINTSVPLNGTLNVNVKGIKNP